MTLDAFTDLVGFDVHRGLISKVKPQIVHLHWISRSGRLGQYKGEFKTVVTARDMWWGTGGCHYSLQCQQYKTSCHECKFFKRPRMLTATKREKAEFLKETTNIAISDWLKDQFSSAGLNFKHIENSVFLQIQKLKK